MYCMMLTWLQFTQTAEIPRMLPRCEVVVSRGDALGHRLRHEGLVIFQHLVRRFPYCELDLSCSYEVSSRAIWDWNVCCTSSVSLSRCLLSQWQSSDFVHVRRLYRAICSKSCSLYNFVSISRFRRRKKGREKRKYHASLSFTRVMCWNVQAQLILATQSDSKKPGPRIIKKGDVQEGLSQLAYTPYPSLKRRFSTNANSSSGQNLFASQQPRKQRPPFLTEVILKPLKGIPDKRKRHLGRLLLLGRGGRLEPAVDLHRVGGLLLQVLGGEVGGVDLGRQARLEGGAEAAEVVEVHAGEEGVTFELVGAAAAEAVLAVAD